MLALINFGLILTIILPLIPYFVSIPKTYSKQDSIKICSSNLELINDNIKGFEALIEKENPDILLLIEVTYHWQELLNDKVSQRYPFQIWEPMEGYFGMAFLSKYPINQSNLIYSSQFKLPNILAEVNYNGKAITFVGIHPPPPINVEHFRMRNEQYQQINENIKTIQTPIVLMGDFNSTGHSAALNILLNNTSLIDSRLGKGLQPSWSIRHYLPSFLALDHMYISPEIHVLKRRTGESFKSDHLPIIMEAALP